MTFARSELMTFPCFDTEFPEKLTQHLPRFCHELDFHTLASASGQLGPKIVFSEL